MAKGKYAKYVNELKRSMIVRLDLEKLRSYTSAPPMIFDRTVVPETPMWFEFWLVYKPGPGPGCGDSMEKGKEPFKLKMPDGTQKEVKDLPHTHPYDEMFCFLPTDPRNVDDLGGEVEYWLGEGKEAEKFIITKPSVVFVPKNTVHCPFYYRKVSRPFSVVIIDNSAEVKSEGNYPLPPGFKL
jgi:hypothetical protein